MNLHDVLALSPLSLYLSKLSDILSIGRACFWNALQLDVSIMRFDQYALWIV